MARIDIAAFSTVPAGWSAAVSGDEIVFPGGDWSVAEPLKDLGRDSITVTFEPGARLIGTTDYQTLITIAERGGWRFDHVNLRGPGNGRRITPDREGCGIQLITCRDCVVEGGRIENCGKIDDSGNPGIAAVYLRGSCRDCTVTGLEIEECNAGVNEDAFGASFSSRGNRATNVRSKNCRAHAIIDNKGLGGSIETGMLIDGWVIDGHHAVVDQSLERYAIQATGAHGVVIGNVQIRHCVNGILFLGDLAHSQISNVTISAFALAVNGGYGVWFRRPGPGSLERPVNCGVDAVVVADSPSHGIYLEVGQHTSINGARIWRPGGCGIALSHPYATISGVRVMHPGSHGLWITGQSGSVAVGGMCAFIGAPEDTSFAADAIRVDGAGGPVTVVGNQLWNDQATAGFRWGINAAGAGCFVEHAHNKFFRLQGTVNPAGLPALP